MTRWITSDQNTTAVLRERRMEPTAGSAEPLTDALQADSAVLVFPATRGDVLVARVRRATDRVTETQPAADAQFEVVRWTDDDAVGYTAGGMLGLMDEPVYEEEAPTKKKWWQRILE